MTVHGFRRDVYDSLVESRDLAGRKNPVLVFNFGTLLRALSGFANQWSKIPSEYWNQDTTAEGHVMAKVSCPCGESPEAEGGLLARCDCERMFFFSGTDVLVANSPRQDLRVLPLDADDAEALGELEPPTPAAP